MSSIACIWENRIISVKWKLKKIVKDSLTEHKKCCDTTLYKLGILSNSKEYDKYNTIEMIKIVYM